MPKNQTIKNSDGMSIGDRMKMNYELPALVRLPKRLPIVIRTDGKCFHTLARKLKWAKPFDCNLIANLQEVAAELCGEIMNAKLAYLQSDEISFLLIDYEKIETESWFNTEAQKMASVVAGMMSAKLSLRLGAEASFDARAFVIPPWEVCNYFLWRQRDWKRNSIQMLGRANFSQKALHGLNCDQIQEKLWQEKEINWAQLPIHIKRGSCVKYQDEKWVVDTAIPDFGKDRQYIEKFVPELNDKYANKKLPNENDK